MRDKLLNEINQKNFYIIEAHNLANYIFDVPSSNRVNLDNANMLLNEHISKKLKEKINFLNSIEVSRDKELNTIEFRRINGKSLGKMYINIESLTKTKLKVGRVGRCNCAAIPGYLIRRKHDFIFNEDSEGTEAVLIIPIEKYTKKYLINNFRLNYFLFTKDCIIGITDLKNVESLFKI